MNHCEHCQAVWPGLVLYRWKGGRVCSVCLDLLKQPTTGPVSFGGEITILIEGPHWKPPNRHYWSVRVGQGGEAVVWSDPDPWEAIAGGIRHWVEDRCDYLAALGPGEPRRGT